MFSEDQSNCTLKTGTDWLILNNFHNRMITFVFLAVPAIYFLTFNLVHSITKKNTNIDIPFIFFTLQFISWIVTTLNKDSLNITYNFSTCWTSYHYK